MEKLLMIVDLAKCVGCFNCLMACKDEHVDNSWLPYTERQQKHGQKWIEPVRHERGKAPYTDMCFVTKLCQHCENAHCAQAFPMAMDRRADGIVLIDAKEAQNEELPGSCPYGMISWNEEIRAAQKCTLCAHLLDEGWEEPRCVQACPLRALSILKIDDENYAELVENQGLQALYDPDDKPRVLYKNLDRYKNHFIAGAFCYKDGEIEKAAEAAKLSLSLNGETLAATETDFFGEFKFDHIPPGAGNFRIEATLDGYKAIHCEARVENESVVLDVQRFEK